MMIQTSISILDRAPKHRIARFEHSEKKEEGPCDELSDLGYLTSIGHRIMHPLIECVRCLAAACPPPMSTDLSKREHV